MTARQPQTQNEAAMLGLLSAQMGGGIFGGGRRRTRALRDGTGSTGPGGLGAPLDAAAAPAMTASPYAAPQVDAPPPITAAPPPPADWANQLGPEMLGNLPQQPLSTQGLPPAPPMRGGPLGNRGMFGNAATPPPGAPPLSPSTVGAGIGGAIQRGGMSLGDTAADAMPKKKGFDWRMIAGIVGDGLLGAAGQPGVYGPAMYRERQARADQQRQLAEITLRSRLDAAKPDYFTVNNDRVRYDPTTGATETLYTAPEDFDRYAASLGAEPGTPEYDRLVQDYVLRTGGPTATGLNMEEEDHRQGNRLGLEGVRQNNRSALVSQRLNNSLTLRQSPTYRQANPLPRKPTAGRGGGGVREGQTATGPGGAKMVYRGGKWEPLK
jgi:hypothetical protein